MYQKATESIPLALRKSLNSKAMKRSSFTIIALAAILLGSSQMGCSKNSGADPAPTPTPDPTCVGAAPTFAANVLPLIQTRCATGSGCHGTGSGNSGGPLTTHAQISAKASTIRSQVNSGAMPIGGTLTAAQKATIVCWINGGSPNN
ncbi:MAG: hypothetical protein EAY75_09865 [Bacteroidetes bacterium]|nr:MAG: hypothetical protein EAY75_09865 [Bacteroidota bacterium]